MFQFSPQIKHKNKINIPFQLSMFNKLVRSNYLSQSTQNFRIAKSKIWDSRGVLDNGSSVPYGKQ